MEALLNKPLTRQRIRRNTEKAFDGDMLIKLYELLQGERDMVRVHSKALGSDICFVNPELHNPEALPPDCPAYTTRELAFVLSLSPGELQRYHYLKMKLI